LLIVISYQVNTVHLGDLRCSLVYLFALFTLLLAYHTTKQNFDIFSCCCCHF